MASIVIAEVTTIDHLTSTQLLTHKYEIASMNLLAQSHRARREIVGR
ncbi:MAG: hypothetical protein KA270_08675 [Saprospiraceae bacterium]|nr:hypothetical protein [Saprospiraceae bacterium]MBP6567229.1 hypothetical protein [Saprospiraceae bacterium]